MTIQIKKTTSLTFKDGTKVPIENLPDEIKEQILIYDEIRQDLVTKSYEVSVYQMALEHKKRQLGHMLEDLDAETKDVGG